MARKMKLRTDATHYRDTNTGPALGGQVKPSWTSQGTIKCKLVYKRGTVHMAHMGVQISFGAIAYLLPGADVRPNATGQIPDKLTISDQDFIVRAVLPDTQGTQFQRAYLEIVG